ncbi:FecR domain-containing protein, partial [Nostoc sp.]|uniref:FecR domain-containing protein n=1 Tax=Nostoc sp. TaxID=1180 RepID=UPI002FF990B9
MFYKSFPLLVIGLWGLIVLPLPNRVSAITPLTRAEIQNLRNIVQLIPKDKLKKRPARKLDAMTPGDGLSTGRSSLADLRFNDGSLARVGEQALFQFLPKTRDFKLTNGTVLLLIPPGKGQTRIQTPNAAAAIRGSALFVRYDQQTDTTIVGALTNSGIEVSNKKASQTQVLEAGQMVIIVKGEFQRLYDFDLRNFYETSQMVRELDLNRQSPVPTPDPAITSVQAETTAALKAQPPIKGEGVFEMKLTPTPDTSTQTTSDTSTQTTSVTPVKTTPDTPAKTTSDTPVKTTPDTPAKTTSDTPTQTTSDTPTQTTSDTSTQTTPDTPAKTTSVTPVKTTPVAPIEPTPVTPTEPTPVIRVTPTPVTSTDPTPVTPIDPTPVIPVTPTPVTSTDPTPVTPIDPTPVIPVTPTPVTSTDPTPVTPIDPTPVIPVTPTPVTSTDPTPVT